MTETANAEMREQWNALSGPKWVKLQDHLDAQLEPIGKLALDAAEIAPGMTVLDVGCGCGATTLEIARRLAGLGRVVGVDISQPMLERAARLANETGAGNVELELADAQTHAFEAERFHVVFSRFGLMFFDDPVAAFVNLRRALRPEGRLSFVCWQAPEKNAWASIPLAVARRYVAVEPPANPEAPGPFGFADGERVRRLLEQAGFEGIRIEPVEFETKIGRELDADRAAEFLTELGPAAAALRKDPEQRPAVAAALAEELGAYENASNAVVLPAAIWLVTARR